MHFGGSQCGLIFDCGSVGRARREDMNGKSWISEYSMADSDIYSVTTLVVVDM